MSNSSLKRRSSKIGSDHQQKVVIVGDSIEMKNRLAMILSNKDVNMVSNNGLWIGNFVLEANNQQFIVCNTVGTENYDHLRSLYYTPGAIFLLLFDLDSISSINKIETSWMNELGGEKVILLGVHNHQNRVIMPYEMLNNWYQRLGAKECLQIEITDDKTVRDLVITKLKKLS